MSALVGPGLALIFAVIHSLPSSPETPGPSLRKHKFFIMQLQMGKMNQ